MVWRSKCARKIRVTANFRCQTNVEQEHEHLSSNLFRLCSEKLCWQRFLCDLFFMAQLFPRTFSYYDLIKIYSDSELLPIGFVRMHKNRRKVKKKSTVEIAFQAALNLIRSILIHFRMKNGQLVDF